MLTKPEEANLVGFIKNSILLVEASFRDFCCYQKSLQLHYKCITSCALQVVHYKLCITSCALQYHFYVNFPISLKLVKLGIYTDVRRTEEVSSHCSYIFLDLLQLVTAFCEIFRKIFCKLSVEYIANEHYRLF